MTQRLSPRSEALIRDALAGDRPPMAIERARVRRGVLAAIAASGTSAAAAGGGAVVASKAASSVAAGSPSVLSVATGIADAAARGVGASGVGASGAGASGAGVSGAGVSGAGVVAASHGAAATVAGGSGVVLAKGAATGGLLAGTWAGAWGVKVTAVALALGAATALTRLPTLNEGRDTAAGDGTSSTPLGKPNLARNTAVSGPLSASAAAPTAANGDSRTQQLPATTAEVGSSGAREPRATPPSSRPGRAGGVKLEPTALPARGMRTAAVRARDAGEPKPNAAPALEQELAALERVQAELRSGRGETALALLDSSRSRGTVLAEERLAAEVFAACQAGQVERARRAAQSFLARNSGSFLTERVRRSCAFEESPTRRSATSRH